MRALVQRVKEAQVVVEGKVIGKIGKGVLVFLGVAKGDTEAAAAWLAKKICHLRIFEDETGKLNLSLNDIGGSALIVSQFTLYGDCKKGRRPSFDKAASPAEAKVLYEKFIELVKAQGISVATGQFGAFMQVYLINDGPVTLLLEK